MTLYLHDLAAVLTVAAVIACVVFALRPWIVVMGWHPGRIHRAARRAARQGLPVCGHCGHPVALWSDTVRVPPNCGECGALYSKCGIVSHATIARVSPTTVVIAALLIPPAGIVGWIAYGGTYESLTPKPMHTSGLTTQPRPSLVRRTAEFTLAPSRVEGETIFRTSRRSPYGDPPPFTLMYEVDVIGQGSTMGSTAVTPTDGRITIELRGDAVPDLDLEYYPATDTWSLAAAGSAAAPGTPMTGQGSEQAIDALYTRGGLALRPWADAEMCEAVERLRTATSLSGGINGFVQTGHAGEAAHEQDTAMVAVSRLGSGEGTSSVGTGASTWIWQGSLYTPPPPPAYAHPLAIIAGLIPVGVGVAMIVMYAFRRSRLLWAASPNNLLAAGPPPLE